MTEALYMTDSYLREFDATVVEVGSKNIVLDKTAFYPSGGGQPHDLGTIECGSKIFDIVNVTKISGKIVHEADSEGLSAGDKVHCIIDWDRRYKLMRMHTAAHIIDAVLYKNAGALCTGNQLGVDKSRIDFSLDVIGKEKMQSFVDEANKIVQRKINVKIYFMKREEALKIPGIVKLAAAMPPNVEELRIVEIPQVDIQADGGTQVKNTEEIGAIQFLGMENKGKNNRRMHYTIS